MIKLKENNNSQNLDEIKVKINTYLRYILFILLIPICISIIIPFPKILFIYFLGGLAISAIIDIFITEGLKIKYGRKIMGVIILIFGILSSIILHSLLALIVTIILIIFFSLPNKKT